MVKNQGVEVALISQFDIRRLPEFELLPGSQPTEKNIVSRYVPVYPGSQIWLEYTVEPPHPPKAAYFFKLLINSHVVTAWDCTEKNGYCGKMMYVLDTADTDASCPRAPFRRRGLKFSNQEDAIAIDQATSDDCIEIRIHRIEHRQRIYEHNPDHGVSLDSFDANRLELIGGGFLEPERTQRRYKYQLLDPADEPFATFRFLYRTYEYLWQNNIIVVPTTCACSTPSSSMIWYDASSTSLANMLGMNRGTNESRAEADEYEQNIPSSPLEKINDAATDNRHLSPSQARKLNHKNHNLFDNPDESLGVIVRNSIEHLRSEVPHPTVSPGPGRFSLRGSATESGSPIQRALPPRQIHQQELVPGVDGVSPSVGKGRRVLSPFTSGGLLRRLISPEPPQSALVTVKQSNAIQNDEVIESVDPERTDRGRTDSQVSHVTNQIEGSGKRLVRLLSRKITRKKSVNRKSDDAAKSSCTVSESC